MHSLITFWSSREYCPVIAPRWRNGSGLGTSGTPGIAESMMGAGEGWLCCVSSTNGSAASHDAEVARGFRLLLFDL